MRQLTFIKPGQLEWHDLPTQPAVLIATHACGQLLPRAAISTSTSRPAPAPAEGFFRAHSPSATKQSGSSPMPALLPA